MKQIGILAMLFLSTVLFHSYTTAFHVEPILSPFTEFLYSFDTGLGSFLSNICDCSKVQSCSCVLQLGGVNVRAEVTLGKVKEGTKPIHFLKTIIYLGDYQVYKEETNVKDLHEKCSVFEDKDSYVVNKNYCIKFNAVETEQVTKVCANLVIKERGRVQLEEEILCVRNGEM